jgi:hypothetical protein
MKKAARPRPEATTQFEQIPVVEVKQLADATIAPASVPSKPPVPGPFVGPLAVKGAKRGR